MGLLVDDAVVVLENTVRHLEEGKPSTLAALLGAKEISFTVLSMTLSLGVIFIPIVFMPGLIGRMFHEMAVTIVIAIIFSGVVAIVVSPMVCARLLRKSEGENRYQRWFNKYFLAFKGHYKRVEWMIARKGLAPDHLAALLPARSGCSSSSPRILPVGDSGMIRGVYLAAEGTSPAQMQAYQKQLMEISKAEPGVDQVIVVTGLQNNQLTTSMGLFIVLLKPEAQRAPIAEITQRIVAKVRAAGSGRSSAVATVSYLNIDTGATSNTQGAYAIS